MGEPKGRVVVFPYETEYMNTYLDRLMSEDSDTHIVEKIEQLNQDVLTETKSSYTLAGIHQGMYQ